MKEKTKSYIYILAAAAMWGTIGVFFRLLTECGLGEMQTVAVRVILSALLYTLYLLVTDRAALKIKLRDAWCFVGAGVVSLVLFNYCYFRAIALSGSMGIAAVLLYTAPVFVLLMSALLFKEKLTAQKALALAVAFVGCLFVTGAFSHSEKLSPPVILFGLGSGLGYALYSIFGKLAFARGYSPKTVTAYSFLFGALACAAFLKPSKLGALLSVKGGLSAIGIAVVCCILPYLLYNEGLKKVEAGRASVIATVEPVVAAVLGVLLFGDAVTPTAVIGIALIVGAIFLLSYEKKEKTETEKQS